MGDRCVSDGVGVSKADGDGAVHGSYEDKGGVARENDVNGAGSRSGNGIGSNYGHVGDRFVGEGGIGHAWNVMRHAYKHSEGQTIRHDSRACLHVIQDQTEHEFIYEQIITPISFWRPKPESSALYFVFIDVE